jgi:hypothetical protein
VAFFSAFGFFAVVLFRYLLDGYGLESGPFHFVFIFSPERTIAHRLLLRLGRYCADLAEMIQH